MRQKDANIRAEREVIKLRVISDKLFVCSHFDICVRENMNK